MSLLVGLPGLLAERGVPLTRALEGLPLTPDEFTDPERIIPYSLACRLLERAATLAQCPHLGLLLGARHDHRVLGLPGELLANAPDLGAALSSFIQLQPGASRAATIYLQRQDGHVVVGYGLYAGASMATEQVSCAAIALAASTLRLLTGGQAAPSEVLFAFRRPADPSPHHAFFGVPVRFDQPQSGLVLPRAVLALPIVGARPAEFERLQRLAAARMPAWKSLWADRVKRTLRPMLLRGEPTAPATAAELGVSVRTLSRRLAAEGSTFQGLLDEVRYATARELLAVTDLPVGEVALALSYATHGAFVDAFRRWSGMAPSHWRRARTTPAPT
ncbi:MAG: AraC family transcriptional regulator [Alsobacter sp.]